MGYGVSFTRFPPCSARIRATSAVRQRSRPKADQRVTEDHQQVEQPADAGNGQVLRTDEQSDGAEREALVEGQVGDGPPAAREQVFEFYHERNIRGATGPAHKRTGPHQRQRQECIPARARHHEEDKHEARSRCCCRPGT